MWWSYESCLCCLAHAFPKTALSHEADVLAAPAGRQQGQGEGARDADESQQENVPA